MSKRRGGVARCRGRGHRSPLRPFTYRGLRRTVEPHLIGIHEAGEPLLVGYQTAGFSGSGELPGWRTFVTTEIDSVALDEARFSGPREGFSADAHAMLEIFART